MVNLINLHNKNTSAVCPRISKIDSTIIIRPYFPLLRSTVGGMITAVASGASSSMVAKSNITYEREEMVGHIVHFLD